MTGEQAAENNQNAAEAFGEAVSIMERLRAPGGCPWDREQTLESIQKHTLEEVYEVFDAIERGNFAELRDELGDLLLQVLFYAQISSDAEEFTIADVVRGLNAKLIRRHPHVFGEAVAENADAVVRTWDAVKQKERQDGDSKKATTGLLDSIPRSMPALMEATKIGSRSAKVGFDWTEIAPLFEKVHEELREVQEELTETPDQQRVEEEFGDLLFVVTNLGRHLHVDPEIALRKANAKFRGRMEAMERIAGSTEAFAALAPDDKEALWLRVKDEEKLR